MRAFRRKATDQTPAIDFDYDAHELQYFRRKLA